MPLIFVYPLSLSLYSQSYHLQTTRDMMRPHPSVTLDPATNYPQHHIPLGPQFRSRNQSYMRAVSTLSQASCVSQVSPTQAPHRGNTRSPGGVGGLRDTVDATMLVEWVEPSVVC